MTLPSLDYQRGRETAVAAERHWWASSLREMIDAYRKSRTDDLDEGNEFALERASVKEDIIADIAALLAERP